MSEIIRAILGLRALAARTTACSLAKYELPTRGNKSIRAMPRCSGRCIVEIAINSPVFGGWYRARFQFATKFPAKGKACSLAHTLSLSLFLFAEYGRRRNPPASSETLEMKMPLHRISPPR